MGIAFVSLAAGQPPAASITTTAPGRDGAASPGGTPQQQSADTNPLRAVLFDGPQRTDPER